MESLMKNIFVLLLVVFSSTANAGTTFRHIGSSQGLPHNQVQSIVCDNKGYIWIGTRNGLARYDGYEMHTYYHRANDEHSLNHNFIHRLFIDTSNRLWICTETGLCRYRQETDDFLSYPQQGAHFWAVAQDGVGQVFLGGDQLCRYDAKADSLVVLPRPAGPSIHSMAVDHHNRLYAVTSQEIFVFDTKRGEFSTLDSKFTDFYSDGATIIAPLLTDSKGRIWIGRNGQGVQWFDPDKGSSCIYPPGKLCNGIVRSITEDQQGRIWIGTERGISVLNPDDNSVTMFTHSFTDIGSISDNAIYTILCDRQQNMWIGSYFGGVDMLPKANNMFDYFMPNNEQGKLNARVVRNMVEPQPGVIWIATEDNGITIYEKKTGLFRPFKAIAGLGSNVHALHYDQENGYMWIGTRFDGLYRYHLASGRTQHYLNSRGLSGNAVFYITNDTKGQIWVGTMHGLRKYDESTDTFLPTSNDLLNNVFAYTMLTDRYGNLWTGTTSDGLFKIDGKTGKVTNLSKSKKNGLKDNYIICLLRDIHGRLWIGTNNEGLQYLDPHNESKVMTFEGHPILSQCTICSLTEDKKNNCIWISTSQGLFVYDQKHHTTVRYSQGNGLAVEQFNYSSAMLTSDSTLWLGTTDGIVTINTNKFTSVWKVSHEVVIGSISVGDKSRSLINTNRIELTYDEAHDFTINYGVILPGGAADVEYQILVSGIDRSWRNIGHERIFRAYNLQPGSYELQVRARSGGTAWDDCPVTILYIHVHPPFYRSIWAWLVYFTVMVVLSYIIWHFVNLRLKEKHDVRLALMEKQKIEELDRIKSDFFTTVSHELKTPLSLIIAPLRSISRQQLKPDMQQHLDMAIKNTGKMSDLINQLVTFNKLETDQFPFYVSLGNPMEFVSQVALIFRHSAQERGIHLSVNCEDNGEEVWFSPNYVELILNNLMSNALKFTHRDGHIEVRASITQDDTTGRCGLRISVKDTGIGIADEEQQRIFDSYYQTQRGYSTNSSGWGIGLALVKRLSEKHQGYVGVESQIGRGSIFTVWLCTDDHAFDNRCKITDEKIIMSTNQLLFSDSTAASLGILAKDDLQQESQSDSPVTLLVVDDNEDMRLLLSRHLCAQYSVLTAEDGLQAILIAQEQQIDLIISDVMMPNMNGMELCKHLKSDMATSHIPIILLTAKSDPADVLLGYESGAEAYVSKPFDIQTLILQVNNILSLIRNRQVEFANNKGIADETDGDGHEIQLSELDRYFIQRVNDLVELNLDNCDFSIRDITRELGVSRSLLHIKMKHLMNISMGDYVRKRRIEKACEMLKKGYNVSEAAYHSGFSGPNYFSKAFKKTMGISPSEYIKNE